MVSMRLAASVLAMAAACKGLTVPQAEVDASSVVARDVITVTMFKDADWAGAAADFRIATQTDCIGLDGTSWTNIISSIRIPSGYRCRLWDSNSCNGDSTPDIYAPGAYNIPSNMNDKTTSFKCYKN